MVDKKKQGRANKKKGKVFERAVVNDLKPTFPEAKRTIQSRQGSVEGCDVEGTPYFIECKWGQSPSVWAALKQADEKRPELDTRPSVAIVHRIHDRTIAVMSYEDWKELIMELDYQKRQLAEFGL